METIIGGVKKYKWYHKKVYTTRIMTNGQAIWVCDGYGGDSNRHAVREYNNHFGLLMKRTFRYW